jgi:hypothetical protein
VAGISGARDRDPDATLRRAYLRTGAGIAGASGILDLRWTTGRLTVVELKERGSQLPAGAGLLVARQVAPDAGEFPPTATFRASNCALIHRGSCWSPVARIPSDDGDDNGFFAPGIEVERVGLAVEWRKGVHVMFRLRGEVPSDLYTKV